MIIRFLRKTAMLIVLSLFNFFATLQVFAQVRQDKATIKFNSQSEQLKSATGWAQNKETGKWMQNKNVIDDKKCPSYWVSHISQNFKWIQFASIIKGGQKYYIFLYENLAGEYKYPSIYSGWEVDKRTHFFILTQQEYDSIKLQIRSKTAENIKISSKKSGYITNKFKILGGEHLYNEENLLAKINNTIDQPSYFETCFIFNLQLIDGQELVRFRLPGSCYNLEDEFKTQYFELMAVDFMSILID